MEIQVPDNFYNNPRREVNLDELTVINYYIRKKDEKEQIVSRDNLLIFVIKGGKKLKYIDGEIEAREGDVIFVERGKYIMYHIINAKDKNYEAIVFSLSDKMISEIYIKYLSNDKKESFVEYSGKCFKVEMNKKIKMEIELILEYFNNENKYSNEILKLKTLEIILNLLTNENGNKFASYFQKVALKNSSLLIKFMEDNYDKYGNIDEFARNFGKSLTSFKREFKETFNDSPKNWINNKKLEKAATLLKNRDNNVTEVCYVVGFESLSHFTNVFKKKYKNTPGKYQKELFEKKNELI